MLRTKVILSQVTNLSDARYAAGMGVDFIGFSIDPENPNFVTATHVNAIADWLSGVSFIGELGKGVTDTSDYKIDYIQISNTNDLSSLEEPIIELTLTKNNKTEISESIDQLMTQASFFIIKIKADELQSTKDMLSEINTKAECYIATDFNESNLDLVLETKPKGIVLYGTQEEKPGLSNYDGIADVLELLEEE